MPKGAVATAIAQAEDVDQELVAVSIPDKPGPVWVTPELAGLWLTRNTCNRKIRPRQVLVLARDMATDHWVYTGEAIKFDINGRLLDGQHRLMAVLKAGVTVQMFAVPGLPPHSQAFMDAGAPRTAADALRFQEEANAATLAATVRFAVRLEGGRSVHDRISHAEIIEWLQRHPDIRRYVSLTSKYYSKIDIKPSVFPYALWRLHHIDEHDAAAFMEDLVEMRTKGTGDPIYTLIQRFRVARKNREKLSPSTELSWIFKTWNAYRTGQQIKLLKVPLSDNEITVPK